MRVSLGGKETTRQVIEHLTFFQACNSNLLSAQDKFEIWYLCVVSGLGAASPLLVY